MESRSERKLSIGVVVLMIIVALVFGVFAGYYVSSDVNVGQLNVLDERIEELSEEIARIEAMQPELESRISVLSSEISEVESSLRGVEVQYDEVISQLEGNQEFLREALEDISSEILSLQSEDDGKTVDVIFEASAGSVVSVRVNILQNGFAGQVQGAGFVFSDEGYIVTNNHVVEDFDAELGIEAVFIDGTIVRGDFVASDPDSDLAVFSVILPEGVEPLPLGDSSRLAAGEPVIAIGNPFGLGGSLTTGIVSQTHRTLMTESGYLIPSVVQFDAAINPGNSGGPLLNYEGEVVGVTTAGVSAGSGIGFAVPSNTVKKVVQSLLEEGEYIHPWTGIQGIEMNLQIAEAMNLSETKGVLIVYVAKYGPAEEAGLREGNRTVTIFEQPVTVGGDVIVQIDDVEIRDFEDLLAYTDENKSPGDTISITVLRNGERLTLPLTLGERPVAYQYPGYVNVKANVFQDQMIILDFLYRPLGEDPAWETIKDRPHMPLLQDFAGSMTESMLNITDYEILAKEIAENDFWLDGDWQVGGAWLIRIQVNLTESPSWERDGEYFKLKIRDPWHPFGFLDSINITSTGFSITNYSYAPALAADISAGSVQDGYLVWLNTQFEESPETYIIRFK